MRAVAGDDALARVLANEADMAAARRVRTVLEYLQAGAGERVLDCGCGLGWFLKVLGELTEAALVGCDRELRRLERARREVGARAPVAAADAVRLPFADASFDKVILSEVLEHLADDRGALVEVRRVVRPGGVVAVTVPNRDYPFLWDPINRVRERLALAPIRSGFFGGIWTDHVRLYRRDEITALVAAAGFAVEEVRQLVHHCVPFAHNLVYGLGVRLLERGWFADADRFRYDRNRGRWWSPLERARAVLRAVDRRNDPRSDEGVSAVILAVKARRPPA